MKTIPSQRVIDAARRWLGTPYHHQASLCGVGCDCLGLVRGIWRDLIGDEPEETPPYTRDWTEARGEETLLEAALLHFVPANEAEPEPADVLIFRMRKGACAKHIGIMTASDRFIHAAEGVGVVEIPFVPWWRRRVVTRVRFPALQGARSPLRPVKDLTDNPERAH